MRLLSKQNDHKFLKKTILCNHQIQKSQTGFSYTVFHANLFKTCISSSDLQITTYDTKRQCWEQHDTTAASEEGILFFQQFTVQQMLY
jgi:hypothetical protein